MKTLPHILFDKLIIFFKIKSEELQSYWSKNKHNLDTKLYEIKILCTEPNDSIWKIFFWIRKFVSKSYSYQIRLLLKILKYFICNTVVLSEYCRFVYSNRLPLRTLVRICNKLYMYLYMYICICIIKYLGNHILTCTY